MKSDDIRILRDIEQYYSTQIDEMPMNGKKPFLSVLYGCLLRVILTSMLAENDARNVFNNHVLVRFSG